MTRLCTVEGCDKPLRARGYCCAHWALWRKYGVPLKKPVPPSYEACTVDGCSRAPRSAYAENCETHYYRLRRRGTLDLTRPQRPSRGICRIDGCGKADKGPHGYCSKHHARLTRNGGPLTLRGPNAPSGEDNPHWTGANATAGAVHQRVRKARGSAAGWGCTDCAKPAEHWSYDHTDPDERQDATKGPYSLDIDRYFPRCVRCHKRFDMDYLAAKRAAA